MFIKLGIIAGILILGGMIFSNEIDTLFPSTSTNVVNSLKEDVSNFGIKATDSVEKRIDESIDKIVDKIAICEEAEESPLGPIKVVMTSSNIDGIIDWIVFGDLD